MESCWSDDRLAAVAQSSQAGGDERHLAHIDQCDACRSKLEAIQRDERLLAELRRTPMRRAASTSDTLVAGYRLEGEIRRGGQGVVHRAIHEATRRVFALKVLSSSSARDRRRFEREIELVSRLDHPYVVALQDSGIAGDVPWCAMDLVDGLPLDEWVRETKPGLRARVELFRRIASGVAHAHQHGVIHRDLKPSNVLVDAHGDPRILDFGAALSALDHRERLRVTAPGEFVGTLAYAAPEQLHGADAAIDTRTDVYALGLILYELIAGTSPHDRRGGVAEIVERVTSLEPAPPSAHARGIGRDLDAIVMKALSKDASDRYGSADALERDVARYLAHEPVEARRHSTLYVLRKLLVRRRKPIAIAAVASTIAGALTFAWFTEHQRAERQRDEAAVVRSVVQDLLGAASPLRMGGDARLIDVYEVVARDLDRALPGAPDVKAEVELTIGDTYRRLLRAAEAETHLRKALARFREVGDRRELQAARAANALALALADQGRADAVPIAEEALAVRERELVPDDPLLAESRRTLAQTLLAAMGSANVARARPLLEQALQGFRRSYGEEHADTAETKLCLARLEDTAPKEIEALLVQAIATFAAVAPDDPRAIGCFETYASFLQSSARFDEARTMLDRAGSLAKKLFGDVLATDLLRRTARLEYARGDMPSAEMLSRRAVAHELRRWADRRPEESAKLRALAYRVEEPGSPSSEPPYARAFIELRRLEGEGSFELAQWMNGIALVLHELGRVTAIEPMLREALEIRCRELAADCPVRQTTIELLARELAREKRGAEMVPLLEESVATYARRGDSDSPGAERAGRLLEVCRAQVGKTGDHPNDVREIREARQPSERDVREVRESVDEDGGGGQGVSAPR